MLVAWSPMRSMFLAQNRRCVQMRDVARILHHVGEELAEQRGVHRVDLVVALADRARRLEVAVGVGVEHLLQLPERQLGHVLDADAAACWRKVSLSMATTRLAVFLPRSPTRSRSLAMWIAAIDLAQVLRHRLAAGDHDDRALLDLALHRSTFLSASMTSWARATSERSKRADRELDDLLGEPAHLGDRAGQPLSSSSNEVTVCSCHFLRPSQPAQPKRPVM